MAARREIARAIVVGGAGFIGSHLVHALANAGVQVTSIDRDPRGRLAGAPARSVQADVSAGDRVLTGALQDPAVDAVFVTVGTGFVPRSLEHPQADLESNVLTVLAVLEALRDSPRPPVVVNFSSAAVYGNASLTPTAESQTPSPVSHYGISKLAGEHYARLYHRLYGIPTLSLRPFSVYGPGQRKLVVHDLLVRVLAGENPLAVRGAADVTRDYVYVADVAATALTLAANAPAEGEAYNVCSGTGTSLRVLAGELARAAGAEVDFTFSGRLRSGDPRHFVGDPSAATLLGARCRTGLTDGLRATAAWLADPNG